MGTAAVATPLTEPFRNRIVGIPVEYYTTTMRSFSRKGITARNIPIKSALIDSSSNRLQNGSDVYVSRIIRDVLEEKIRSLISLRFDMVGLAAFNALSDRVRLVMLQLDTVKTMVLNRVSMATVRSAGSHARPTALPAMAPGE